MLNFSPLKPNIPKSIRVSWTRRFQKPSQNTLQNADQISEVAFTRELKTPSVLYRATVHLTIAIKKTNARN
jgi:hypothetical protein